MTAASVSQCFDSILYAKQIAIINLYANFGRDTETVCWAFVTENISTRYIAKYSAHVWHGN